MEAENITAEVLQTLCRWYDRNAVTLPWREDTDPYRIWISEIMLQQTRISAVLEYYARFMKRLPDIRSLAEADEEELMKLWQGLGYYNRARNLQKTARILTEQYAGRFPADYEQIRSLPGIGDYTAGAIASIAFGIPVPAVDGNVLRVMTRILGDERDIAKETTKKQFREFLLPLIPKECPGTANQALMELGEHICLPNGEPLCMECPVKELCSARKTHRINRIPVKSGGKARRIEERTVYLLFHAGKIALRKRPERGLLANLWEFPSAEFGAEQGIQLPDIGEPEPAGNGIHVFSHIEWHMTAMACECRTDRLPDGWVWADWRELKEVYAVPTAFRFVRGYVQKKIEQNS